MARLIDADKMLSEVRQVAQILSEKALIYPGVLNILRNWVCRQPAVPAYGQWIGSQWGHYYGIFRVLSWARRLYPDIPKDLQGRVKWYFGEEVK